MIDLALLFLANKLLSEETKKVPIDPGLKPKKVDDTEVRPRGRFGL